MLAFPQPDTFAFKPTTNPPDAGEFAALVVVDVVGMGVTLVVAAGWLPAVIAGTAEPVDAALVVALAAVTGDDGTAGAGAAETTGEGLRPGRVLRTGAARRVRPLAVRAVGQIRTNPWPRRTRTVGR